MDAAAASILSAAAADVLSHNDRGDYSVPARGIYPMQFNWDSAFAALGYGYLPDGDGARAWRELELLAAAQKDDGMLPHIIFRGDYHGYFPGPDVWQAGGNPPTSGISNPPVAAIAASILRRRHPPPARARYRRLLSALAKWHKWMADVCLHPDYDAFVAAHPWETGRDNACDWDDAMARIQPRQSGGYQRSDTRFVAAAQRPHQADYDRFLEIVAAGRECRWQQKRFRARSPFAMLDPGITAILAAAADRLDMMLADEGMDKDAKMTEGIGARARRGMAFLWNDAIGGYAAFDPAAKKHVDGLSSAAFLAPLAGLDKEATKGRHERLMRAFDRFTEMPFAVASYDPAHRCFSPRRYWRGPVWLPVNLLIAEGMRAAGEKKRADSIVESSLRLVEKSGFCEYFNPQTGEGLGGAPFTWTAAAVLHFLNAHKG